MRYSNYDRELYAIVQALRYWRHYLLPNEFTLYSDHDALRFLHSQRKLNARHARWTEVLQEYMTRRDREVIDFTRYRVKNNTELTNLMKMNRIQGYNGKYGSNPQGIKQFLDVIFKFDQIGREIDGRNWYFKKVDFKSIPRNKKSSNLDLISRRNQDSKWREIFERENERFKVNFYEIES